MTDSSPDSSPDVGSFSGGKGLPSAQGLSTSDGATNDGDNNADDARGFNASGQERANYVVVARRYRPQTFEELIGQRHVSQALTRAITSERVGHAYLFTGARGVGKTSAARILAKALNCAAGTSATPCNQCELCQSVSSGDDIDVLEIDGASNRGIDEIRQLRQNVAVRPSRARYKIYIIDEVHMLTKEAFNALLKTLEEPPEHVKFIFATTEPTKIPITILSRCQRYDFAGIEAAAIQDRLQQIASAEGVSVDPEAVQILAMRAAGSMRDSQSLLEQLLSTGAKTISAVDVTTMLGIAPAMRLSQLVQPLVDHNAATALDELDAAIAAGAEVSQLIDQLLGYFRDVMTQSVGCDESSLLYALPGQLQEVRAVAEQLGVHTLLAIVQILDQTAARMRMSTQTRTLAEMAIVRICHLENLDALPALIAQLKQDSMVKQDAADNSIAAAVKKNAIVEPSPSLAAAPQRAMPPTGVAVAAATASTAERLGESMAASTAGSTNESTTESTTESALGSTTGSTTGATAGTPPVTAPAGNATSPAAGASVATDPNENDTTQVRPVAATTQPAAIVDPAATSKSAGKSASVLSAGVLSSENVEAVWKQVLESLTGMVMDHAAEADQISVDDNGRLLISFHEAFHRDVFERPANRSRLEKALQDVCGKKISFLLGTHKRIDAPNKPAARAPSRRQQQAEIATQPFVKRAMELFDGDPGRLRYVPPENN